MELCTREKIKQELATAGTPELNGIVERQIAVIEAAGLTARTQTLELYPNKASPKGESLWAEKGSWACNAFICTETSAHPKLNFPYEIWYGTPPQSSLPFLKPGYRKIKGRNKLKTKVVKCWYIGPALIHARDAMLMLCKSGRIVVTRKM